MYPSFTDTLYYSSTPSNHKKIMDLSSYPGTEKKIEGGGGYLVQMMTTYFQQEFQKTMYELDTTSALLGLYIAIIFLECINVPIHTLEISMEQSNNFYIPPLNRY